MTLHGRHRLTTISVMSGEIHRKMCRRYNVPFHAHELTFSCLGRQPFLLNHRARTWLAEAIDASRQRHQFDLWAYVVMPEHVHLLLWPRAESYSIPAILQGIKQSVGRKAVAYARANWPEGLAKMATGRKDRPHSFWLEGGGFDKNIRQVAAARKVAEYIHNNPVKRGLVQSAEDWTWPSYNDWEHDKPGPIAVDKASFLDALSY